MKLFKRLCVSLGAAALAMVCFMAASVESKAAYTPVYNGNYDQYGFDKNGFDQYGIKYDLGSYYNNAKTKMRIIAEDTENIAGNISVYYNDPAAKIVSVKSSSKNLIAKIIANGDSNTTVTKTDYKSGRSDTSTETVYGNGAEIALHAKRSGNYKVVITTRLSTGKLLKKTIRLKATTNSPYTFSYANSTKKKNSSGGYFNTQFYTVKTGILTVKASKGYKVTSIKFANSFDDKGEFKYKKISNGTKVSLNTKTQRTIKSIETYTHNGKNFTRTTTDTYARNYDYIYPVSSVKITYKDTWLGNVFETTSYLYYRNR